MLELTTFASSRRHPYVIGVLVLIATALSALVWLHPTLGFASGGIIDGADLRAPLLALLWLGVTIFAVTSTVVLSLVKARPLARYAGAYVAGAAAVVAGFPLLDKFI